MAYDEGLAERVRAQLGGEPDITEKRMFGGLAFLLGGNMSVGVYGDELLVRVGREESDDALAEPGTRLFDMAQRRPMHGWILVAPEAVEDDGRLAAWVARGAGHARSLPAKA
jgi:TfoX/Sxy family transcriptional regulator of competence genes